ncbi:MAG: tRNA lysidine(34) synthetase TilS [Verrucomicrobia bacterium]|nr:tRNA lysidine(34) synthetase TilS [Verrucomicrobiota bacterium]
MIRKIRAAAERHGLVPWRHRIVAAVSGGADSVALLHALVELLGKSKSRIIVAHLHHGIRGAAADADRRFVRDLAARLGLKFITERVRIPEIAARLGLSIEMAAREERYAFLLRTARHYRALVATAHTADDHVETILLKLARGAGSRGLSGIPEEIGVHGIRVLRPLLDVTRKEIEIYLLERQEKWREDATNRDTAHLRNRVRHEILPMLERRLNPDIRKSLARTASILREEDAFLDIQAEKELERCVRSRNSLAVKSTSALHRALVRRVIRLWLVAAGIPPARVDFDMTARVETLLHLNKGGGHVELTDNLSAAREYDEITVRRAEPMDAGFRVRIAVPGRTEVPRAGVVVETTIAPGLAKMKKTSPGMLPAFASLRWDDNPGHGLVVRSWRKGDRFRPFGMKGTKKLQDVFVDEKIPAARRGRIPLFECDGRIVLVSGYRVAAGWEVLDPRLPALQVSIKPLPGGSGPAA